MKFVSIEKVNYQFFYENLLRDMFWAISSILFFLYSIIGGKSEPSVQIVYIAVTDTFQVLKLKHIFGSTLCEHFSFDITN